MIKGVIFDLDGTLVDTLDDLTDAMNAGLAQFDLPGHTKNDCREMIGNGLTKFAERALGPAKEHLADELKARMLDHYNDHCLLKTAPYEGIPEVIDALSTRGVKLAVLTNKHLEPAEVITRHFFGDMFNPIIGNADGVKLKPDPDTTYRILRQWQLNPDDVLFVGDSESDLLTAQAAGIKCLACEWGFRSKEQLQAAGAEIFLETPDQIMDFLA